MVTSNIVECINWYLVEARQQLIFDFLEETEILLLLETIKIRKLPHIQMKH